MHMNCLKILNKICMLGSDVPESVMIILCIYIDHILLVIWSYSSNHLFMSYYYCEPALSLSSTHIYGHGSIKSYCYTQNWAILSCYHIMYTCKQKVSIKTLVRFNCNTWWVVLQYDRKCWATPTATFYDATHLALSIVSIP